MPSRSVVRAETLVQSSSPFCVRAWWREPHLGPQLLVLIKCAVLWVFPQILQNSVCLPWRGQQEQAVEFPLTVLVHVCHFEHWVRTGSKSVTSQVWCFRANQAELSLRKVRESASSLGKLSIGCLMHLFTSQSKHICAVWNSNMLINTRFSDHRPIGRLLRVERPMNPSLGPSLFDT